MVDWARNRERQRSREIEAEYNKLKAEKNITRNRQIIDETVKKLNLKDIPAGEIEQDQSFLQYKDPSDRQASRLENLWGRQGTEVQNIIKNVPKSKREVGQSALKNINIDVQGLALVLKNASDKNISISHSYIEIDTTLRSQLAFFERAGFKNRYNSLFKQTISLFPDWDTISYNPMSEGALYQQIAYSQGYGVDADPEFKEWEKKFKKIPKSSRNRRSHIGREMMNFRNLGGMPEIIGRREPKPISRSEKRRLLNLGISSDVANWGSFMSPITPYVGVSRESFVLSEDRKRVSGFGQTDKWLETTGGKSIPYNISVLPELKKKLKSIKLPEFYKKLVQDVDKRVKVQQKITKSYEDKDKRNKTTFAPRVTGGSGRRLATTGEFIEPPAAIDTTKEIDETLSERQKRAREIQEQSDKRKKIPKFSKLPFVLEGLAATGAGIYTFMQTGDAQAAADEAVKGLIDPSTPVADATLTGQKARFSLENLRDLMGGIMLQDEFEYETDPDRYVGPVEEDTYIEERPRPTGRLPSGGSPTFMNVE